jgi:outer membrane protein assembly factor BamB/plastocyanin
MYRHSSGSFLRGRRLSVGLAVALLLGLVACGNQRVETKSVPPEVARAANAWPHPNRDFRNTRANPNAKIDKSNVKRLGVAWTLPLPATAPFGAAATNPLIANGVAYLQDLNSNVYALDLATGKQLWRAENNNPSVGPNGVALGFGKVFALRSPRELVALDAKTGHQVWSQSFENAANIEPVVYGDHVYLGTTAGANGAYKGGTSGIAYALNHETGKIDWKFQVVDDGFWGNPTINSGGGLWYPPAVDERRGVVYWGTGNPAPFPGTVQYPNGTSRPGPNLHTDSLVALDIKTGQLRWSKQVRSHDILDLDLQLSPILAHVKGLGDLILASGKLGVVYGINPDTHEIVWQRAVGTHQNDNLQEIPAGEQVEVYPGTLGGVETPMAYADNVVYAAVTNLPTVHTADSWGATNGTEALRHAAAHTKPASEGTSELVAIDARNGKVLWDHHLPSSNFGAATVVNDLVFTSTFDGTVYALDRHDGEVVWTYKAPAGINGWPAVAGDTVLVPAGVGKDAALVALRLGARRTSSTTTSSAPPVTATPGGQHATVTVSAKDMKFSTDAIRVAAGTQVTIAFTNDDSLPHNIAVYRDQTAQQAIFVGKLIAGPGGTITYEFQAPSDRGTYFFRCDVHPWMNGQFIVE